MGRRQSVQLAGRPPARRAARRPSRAPSGDAIAVAVAVALALFFGGRWVFRRLSPHFEDFLYDARWCRCSQLEHVGKDYAKVETRGGRLRLVCDLLRGARRGARVPRARRRELRAAARRIARRHRRERRGQVDAAQDRRRRRSSRRAARVAGQRPRRARCSSSDRAFIPTTRGLRTSISPRRCSASRPREIAAKRDEIVAFADIGEHIDDPIKHYSSGMVVRLGFAVATALAPDMLITDEVLAVGDESFQKKCIAWMERYLADGGTLLLCSHSMYHVQKLCRNALWLQRRPRRALRPGDGRDAGLSRVSRGEERGGQGADHAAEAAAAGVYAVQSLELTPRDSIAQGETLNVAAKCSRPTAACRWCWWASCAPTARRSTASRPTWTAVAAPCRERGVRVRD